jgi:SAM-dependent methyltransferase
MIVRTEFGFDYDTKRRLASYWHQTDECRKLGGKSVLLIGHGSGLGTILLERAGFEVTTLDIQAHLAPRIIGDVRALPFGDQVFDIAVCCQVLEHLPREFFIPALKELRRVIKNGLVLSLPDSGWYSTTLSRLLRRKDMMTIPAIWKKTRKTETEHFWEVNLDGVFLPAVQRDIDESGFTTGRTFRVWENPYHRFWRLFR